MPESKGKRKINRDGVNGYDKLLRKEAKLEWLAKAQSIAGVDWQELTPDSQHTWLIPA
jgi:predicted helicase